MQHVLVANKKRLVQGWKNAVAHSRSRQKHGVHERFFRFYTWYIW